MTELGRQHTEIRKNYTAPKTLLIFFDTLFAKISHQISVKDYLNLVLTVSLGTAKELFLWFMDLEICRDWK